MEGRTTTYEFLGKTPHPRLQAGTQSCPFPSQILDVDPGVVSPRRPAVGSPSCVGLTSRCLPILFLEKGGFLAHVVTLVQSVSYSATSGRCLERGL